jgi:hypothetical protein
MRPDRQVAIVHYNTPELTEACIMSLRKHGGMDYPVTIFDNSDKLPFTKKMDGVTVIDNTKGQIIDFDKELEKFPDRSDTSNRWGSVRHMMSIQALWDILPNGFLLMDSDILLKQNPSHMFNRNVVAVGHVQKFSSPFSRHKTRLVPMLCYINVPKCRICGLTYFDPERAWKLYVENNERSWYDTGASFYEDIHNHKGGAHGLRIDVRPMMEHLHAGSWNKSRQSQLDWLQQHKDLWMPTPRMRGEKRVAICAIGRNENSYAVEWVEHYKKLGVAKMFIYDNYFDGETPLAVTLEKYVKSGLVEIVDVHNKQDLQCRAYEHCYKLHGEEYAWIGFLDFDEFLCWKGRKKIETMFAQYQKGDCILVNWRIMTDNGLVHYEDKPLKERFAKPMELYKCVKYDWPENEHVKSFVRGGLGSVRFVGPHNPNTPMLCINPSGKEVKQRAFAQPLDHSVMWIDHYWTKTAEEWINTKLSRGYCSGRTYIENFMKVQGRYFFSVNERTPEKEAIVYGRVNPTTE